MITKLFAQTDPRWSKEMLGNNASTPANAQFTIGNYGCVVTAYGNMLVAITGNMNYTPEDINNWMKANNGFVGDGGIFIWGAALGLGHVEAHGTASDLATVNSWLQDPLNYAILEVKPKTTLQHFVMAPYVDEIIDSEDGILKNINTYPFISAHLYRSTDPVVEAALAVAPAAPTSGSVTVNAQPFLNLRTGPGTNFSIGKGTDGNGNAIYSLPTGAEVKYVNAVAADSNSSVQGTWLVSLRGNYFWAGGTNYQA